MVSSSSSSYLNLNIESPESELQYGGVQISHQLKSSGNCLVKKNRNIIARKHSLVAEPFCDSWVLCNNVFLFLKENFLTLLSVYLLF